MLIQEDNRDQALDSFSILKFLPCLVSVGRTYRTRMNRNELVSRGFLVSNPSDAELFGNFHDMPPLPLSFSPNLAMTGAEVHGDSLRRCQCAKHGKPNTRLIRTEKSRHHYPDNQGYRRLVTARIYAHANWKKPPVRFKIYT